MVLRLFIILLKKWKREERALIYGLFLNLYLIFVIIKCGLISGVDLIK